MGFKNNTKMKQLEMQAKVSYIQQRLNIILFIHRIKYFIWNQDESLNFLFLNFIRSFHKSCLIWKDILLLS